MSVHFFLSRWFFARLKSQACLAFPSIFALASVMSYLPQHSYTSVVRSFCPKPRRQIPIVSSLESIRALREIRRGRLGKSIILCCATRTGKGSSPLFHQLTADDELVPYYYYHHHHPLLIARLSLLL